MSTVHPRRAVAPALTLALLATSGLALADASAADKAAARELGIAGIQLADKGDCAGAVVKLRKAAELYAAPTIVERLGECQIALGKLVAGSESLQSVVHDDLGPSPNPVFVEAQKRALKVLEATRPRIAKVVIHLAGPKPDDARITVDGERVPPALLDSDRPTDPGAHQIAGSAPGFKEASSSVTLAEGARQEVTLTLEPESTAPPVATGPATPGGTAPAATAPAAQPATAVSPSRGGGSVAPAIGAFVVGVAGIAVGSVFGSMASSKKTSLDGVCDANHGCPASAQPDIDAMNQNATISTVGFVAGGVGLATGVVLLLTRSSGSEPPAHAAVTPLVGPGSLGLRGTF